MKLKMIRDLPGTLLFGIVLLFIIIILISGASIIAPFDPIIQDPPKRLQQPDNTHILGTDQFGRDIFARVLYGGRSTLTASLTALSCALLIGVFVGMIAGLYGGKVDIILMRIVDVLMAFPFMVLAIIITALFGTGFIHLLVAIVAVWWVPFARLARSIVLNTKNDTEVSAAIVLGAPKRTIIIRELLPKVISPALVLSTFELGNLMLSISALSFFGLGSKPPSPEWGSMLADSKAYFFQAPHVLLGPTLFIFLTVLSLNLVGEGLRDLLDPYEIPNI